MAWLFGKLPQETVSIANHEILVAALEADVSDFLLDDDPLAMTIDLATAFPSLLRRGR